MITKAKGGTKSNFDVNMKKEEYLFRDSKGEKWRNFSPYVTKNAHYLTTILLHKEIHKIPLYWEFLLPLHWMILILLNTFDTIEMYLRENILLYKWNKKTKTESDHLSVPTGGVKNLKNDLRATIFYGN